MQAEWIKGEANRKLAVIVMGWASSPELVGHIRPQGYDLLILYDHRDIVLPEGIKEALEPYTYRILVAWSFGVWVAEQVLADVAFDKAIAINGTPYPTDEKFGLGARRLAVTLRGLAKGGTEPFERKTYAEWYDTFENRIQARPLEENIAELEFLANFSTVPYPASIAWDMELVGSRDEIFPPENMHRYWGNRAKEVNLPHFPFGDENLITELF